METGGKLIRNVLMSLSPVLFGISSSYSQHFTPPPLLPFGTAVDSLSGVGIPCAYVELWANGKLYMKGNTDMEGAIHLDSRKTLLPCSRLKYFIPVTFPTVCRPISMHLIYSCCKLRNKGLLPGSDTMSCATALVIAEIKFCTVKPFEPGKVKRAEPVI